MGKTLHSRTQTLIKSILLIFALFSVSCQAVTVKAIGQIESLYMERASMRILNIPDDASGTSPLKVGQKVSFMLPPDVKKSRGKGSISFGRVVEADLEGNPITEYSGPEGGATASEPVKTTSVLVWTANRVARVKDEKKYLGEPETTEKSDHHGKKDRKNKKNKKDKEPDKIWTQEETVRGKIFVKNQRLFIKEEYLRSRDLGLDVMSDEWYKKLLPYQNRTVVVHGTTKRASAASGSLDITNIIKIYPK